ncbi:glycosyl transferase family 9 [Pseudopedobacter saltans DSM 12145]|uniref:Glycosyl transferase family 9 n=1 Tax=Pseudopedobacter saltans (strain ATCC 51119 / DSM 12145 / JCM 21818 / CCUG 39354 / LMG 10337 / NBRC 100064 / NCIMB 13643) TaxID=762903 RepID=F0SDS8_PSESL|nr:glycosyltransferase family 9 protein [Pseudopedobacter saltans]ADY51824.1 glycosyl transferase family 9 [Pseudopedobacter saltans DSM 12145]
MEPIKNLLCFRADNFGDLLMSEPAIRALKETFDCRITVLTSTMGSKVVPLIEEIDDCIVFDLPWVKVKEMGSQEEVLALIKELTDYTFDSCIIFSVFSQNILPAALIVWLAKIPLRIGYCRENPYDLLNGWLPDKEPYEEIVHQVERDLRLVAHMGASTADKSIRITIPVESELHIRQLLAGVGLENDNYLVVHIGVSENKRKYPLEKWIEVCQELINRTNFPLVFTGDGTDIPEIKYVIDRLEGKVFNLSGLLSLPETAALMQKSRLLIAVNTGIVHLAAALAKPVVLLYAQTNPQHLPWMTSFKVLEFSVSEKLASKNEVIRWLRKSLYKETKAFPSAEEVYQAFSELNSEIAVN